MISADDIVRILGLQPLPMEGGFFRETYRSAETMRRDALPTRYTGPKAFSTAIYYLLTPVTCSTLHRLPTDEVCHFYLGGPTVLLQLHPDGMSEVTILGPELGSGHKLQAVVPKGTWQGSFLQEGSQYALMGTTVAPAFDFSDYEPADRSHLLREYPDRKEMIVRLT